MKHVDCRPAALVLCVAMLVVASAGCTSSRATEPSTAAAAITTGAISSAQSTALAGTVEARQLLGRFNQPEQAGDPGYELLGLEHNDVAGWTRAAVLGHTDYPRLVRSLVSQQSSVPSAALSVFARTLASRGTTATYDSVMGSEWRLENDRASKDDGRLVTLIPASTAMGLLFDRQGRLLQTYDAKAMSVSGTVAKATFARPGASDVVLEFELDRDATGGLRIATWTNYAQFKSVLRGNEIVDGMP